MNSEFHAEKAPTFFYLATMEKLEEDKELETLPGEPPFPEFGEITVWGVFKTHKEAQDALINGPFWYPYDYAVIEEAELGLMPVAESRQLYKKNRENMTKAFTERWEKIEEPAYVKHLTSIIFG